MAELRQNLATKEWVIIATERAKRPEDFKARKEKKEQPPISQDCPFCPGNESKTPYETYTLRDEYGKWKVRVIPNKYPALLQEGTLKRNLKGIERCVSGVGVHEVIIESPIHNLTLALMPENDIIDVLKVYKNRYKSAISDERVSLVIIFRNHGELAGASLTHPHSQIIGTPIIPQYIRQRLEEAMRYYDDTGECVYCKVISEEINYNKRVIVETSSFVAFTPYAAISPFHTWILPKRHMASFDCINDSEINDLAKILKVILQKMYYGLDDPDYNLVVRSAPEEAAKLEYYHWYITILPRLSKTAGFELGSGIHINPTYPEENASFLRGIPIR